MTTRRGPDVEHHCFTGFRLLDTRRWPLWSMQQRHLCSMTPMTIYAASRRFADGCCRYVAYEQKYAWYADYIHGASVLKIIRYTQESMYVYITLFRFKTFLLSIHVGAYFLEGSWRNNKYTF